jgi:PTS system cellobiose-specific IIC component
VVANIPWVTPVGIGGWLATGGHISGAILSLVNFGISIAIYIPFVILQGRMEAKRQQTQTVPKSNDTFSV